MTAALRRFGCNPTGTTPHDAATRSLHAPAASTTVGASYASLPASRRQIPPTRLPAWTGASTTSFALHAAERTQPPAMQGIDIDILCVAVP